MKIIRQLSIGAAGRMGVRILAAIHETPNILLAAAVERKDHPYSGAGCRGNRRDWKSGTFPVGSLKEVIASGDVIIDFTNAESSLKNLQIAAESGKARSSGPRGSPPQQGRARSLARKFPAFFPRT